MIRKTVSKLSGRIAIWRLCHEYVQRKSIKQWTRVSAIIVLLVIAGCDGLDQRSTSTHSPSLTVTPTPTVTETSTMTSTATSTEIMTEPVNWSKNKKHLYFSGEYYNVMEHTVNAENYSIENGTLHFTYIMRQPSNATENRNGSSWILTGYSSLADIYSDENTTVTKEWIPRQLNVTALHPETGEVYWRGHTNYTLMNEYRTGEREYPGYLFPYYDSLEYGPAHPKYEESEHRARTTA